MAASSAEAEPSGARAHNTQLNWLDQAEEQVVNDDLNQLLSETRGVCEKLADAAVKMGAWQMVLWQPRWVFAEIDGFCYQKISTTEVAMPIKVPACTPSVLPSCRAEAYRQTQEDLIQRG